MTDTQSSNAPSREHSTQRPASGAAPFGVDELFFSRTDPRGVIASGNAVFQRVCDHPWEDLIGAPHKIIRHPDMPSAVFALLWKALQAGRPFGAYVKNQTRDGLHYWVYAIMTPIEDGFLSVRMKPTSALFQRVEKLYEELQTRVQREGLRPEAAADALCAQLESMGYGSYESFMAQGLTAEVEARTTALGRPINPTLREFQTLTEALGKVQEITHTLPATFAEIGSVPTNMRILASQLEASGGPISVISANYGAMSDEISAWTHQFVIDSNSAFGCIHETLAEGLFLHGVAQIQQEALQQFQTERATGSARDHAQDMALLERQARHFQRLAHEGLERITDETQRFARAVSDMKRLVTGLSSTRMMCKIEGARLHKGRDSLGGIIQQLDGFQDRVEDQIAQITDFNRALQTGAENLRAMAL